MASICNNINISFETRLCKVEGKLGYFHCWEYYSRPVPASVLKGGAPAGVRSGVFGIVEFPDGVRRVDPYAIQFCDEQNAVLCEMAKVQKGEEDVT